MAMIATDLNTWPRRKNGEPIFRTSDDAILYARLAHKRTGAIDEMKAYRTRILQPLKLRTKYAHQTLQRFMNYAVRAQFFRECYEEMERINREDKQ